MTNQDFCMWLEGFMAAKSEFDADDVELIKEKMGEIQPACQPYQYHPYYYWSVNPFRSYTYTSGYAQTTTAQQGTPSTAFYRIGGNYPPVTYT